jgi:hypothetical protein
MTDQKEPNMEMKIIPPHKWPTGSAPDDNLYSLNVGPRTELVWDDEAKGIVEVDLTLPNEHTGFSGLDRPDYPAQVGTYTEISKEAMRLNNAQKISGDVYFMFFPHPVQKLAA